jgi:hypothetical protein
LNFFKPERQSNINTEDEENCREQLCQQKNALNCLLLIFNKQMGMNRIRVRRIYILIKTGKTEKKKSLSKVYLRCFGIMGGHGNLAFNLVVKLSVELGYVFLSLTL